MLLGPDSIPVAELEIELHRVAPDTAGVISRTDSDGDGAFAFDFGPRGVGETAVYMATARYEGVLYFGAALHDVSEDISDYRIRVWEVTAVTEPALAARRLVVSSSGAGIVVTDLIELANTTPATQIASDSEAPGWVFSLPSGTGAAARAPGPLTGREVEFLGDGFRVLGPVPPGGRSFVVEYPVELDGASLELDRAVPRLELLVDVRLGDITVEGLQSAGFEQLAEGAYVRWIGSGLPAGATVRLSAAPVPELRRWAWVSLAVAFFLLAGAFYAWSRVRG